MVTEESYSNPRGATSTLLARMILDTIRIRKSLIVFGTEVIF